MHNNMALFLHICRKIKRNFMKILQSCSLGGSFYLRGVQVSSKLKFLRSPMQLYFILAYLYFSNWSAHQWMYNKATRKAPCAILDSIFQLVLQKKVKWIFVILHRKQKNFRSKEFFLLFQFFVKTVPNIITFS